MYYAGFTILSLIIHLIINHEVLKDKGGDTDDSRLSYLRYRQFMICVTVYYVSDILWGFLHQGGIVSLVYADTFIYFLSMSASVLLWTLYVVAYIDRKGPRSTSLQYGGIAIFSFTVLILVVNIFTPVLFSFDSNGEYIPGVIRYFIFITLFLLHTVLAVYSLIVSSKKTSKDRAHYVTVSISCAGMAVFILLQILEPLLPFYAIGLLVSTCLMHVFVEEDEKLDMDRTLRWIEEEAEREHARSESVRKEKDIYTHIADSLAEDYEAIYYINIETGEYREFSPSELYESMEVPMYGEDFYSETQANIDIYVHPDDREFAKSLYRRESMLSNLEGRSSFSYKYRVMVGGEPRYFRFVTMIADDGDHFVLCEKDITDEITAEMLRKQYQTNHVTFGQIAESLASNYDVIYYVDSENGDYIGYTTRNIYGQLEVAEEGDDFFKEAEKNIELIIHYDDRHLMRDFLNRDHLISALDNKKQIETEYRMTLGDTVRHTRLSVRRSSDMKHFIVGVENIDDEVMKEKELAKALNTEKELARRDELTGIKNKTAYTELEASVQRNIDDGMDYLPFAIAVCDINDLKLVNDTQGHKAGDEYIKASAKLLCDVFGHSPVFRIGGDEFAVFLRGDDYTSRESLMIRLRERVEENRKHRHGPIVAVGMAEFIPKEDTSIAAVFERADNIMYEDKRRLKQDVEGE